MSYAAELKHAAALLRSWGVEVTVRADAATNGRPLPFAPTGVFAHHTASAITAKEDASRNVVLRGRPDVAGPLAQVFVARDCSVDFLTFGRANHAGAGGPLAGVPRDSGNRYFVGVEVDNNGTSEKYSDKLYRTTTLVYAALLIALGRDERRLFGHKEWTSRKIDPRLDMTILRAAVRQVIAEKTRPTPTPVSDLRSVAVQAGDTVSKLARAYGTDPNTLALINGLTDPNAIAVGQTLVLPGKPALGSLVYGNGSPNVRLLQLRLADLGFYTGAIDGRYGTVTKTAVAAYQKHIWPGPQPADGLVGPSTYKRLFG